jgi:hypothetical protein
VETNETGFLVMQTDVANQNHAILSKTFNFIFECAVRSAQDNKEGL